MSTRSFIGKLNSNGFVSGIYCHFDGYPEHTGKILQNHYVTLEKVNALLALGNLSSIGPEIGEKRDFADNNDRFCKAYHRDRGEDFEENKLYVSVDEMVKNVYSDMGAEFAYVFADGKWQTYEL